MTVVNDLQKLFRDGPLKEMSPYSREVFRKMGQCHTAGLGSHLYRCDNALCAGTELRYHCCGNRHCPNCGSMKREAWVEERTNELLPTSYYHLVFTLPHGLGPIVLGNRKTMFKMLFGAASETLLKFGPDPGFLGGQAGITMVLHTWGQDLSFHPHVHCIVSGGGCSNGKWVPAKRTGHDFIFPVPGLRKMYKAIFMGKLRAETSLKKEGVDLPEVLRQIGKKQWNVYAKAPFGGPAQVVEYLGRYTHKIAITKHRILEVTDRQVRFRYKDYADGNKTKEMSLSRREFLRRFGQHILPKGFVKIRHYGYLQNRWQTPKAE